jgi:hypothetical protein
LDGWEFIIGYGKGMYGLYDGDPLWGIDLEMIAVASGKIYCGSIREWLLWWHRYGIVVVTWWQVCCGRRVEGLL